MHAVELVDLASVLAIHGPSLLYRREMIPAAALHGYWTSSRSRFDGWHLQLSNCRHLIDAQAFDGIGKWWEEHSPLLEEILVSEVLSRIYAALGASLDHARDNEEISPITHSVFITHLEARSRALRLIIDCRVTNLEAAVRMNQLRSRMERWSDCLLAQLFAAEPQRGFRYAMELRRYQHLANEIHELPPGEARQAAAWSVAAGIGQELRYRCRAAAPSREHNQGIGDAVLMCLRPDLFDSLGTCKSLWLHRLEHSADRAAKVLDELDQSDISGSEILGGYEMVHTPRFGHWTK